jgi:hypothetical protein
MIGLTLGAYSQSQFNTLFASLFVGAIFLALFIVRSRRITYPLVELRMFKIKEVTGGLFAMFFNIITWTAVLLLLSLQFQLVLNMSPLEAGLRILPFEIAFLAFGPLSGRLSDRLSRMPFILSGLTLSTIALFLFSTTNQSTPYLVLSVYMIIMGFGTGLFIAPNLRSVMSSVSDKRRGIGSALFALFVNLGLTVSLNIAILVMSLTAPYDVITRIVSAVNPLSIPTTDRLLFVESLKNTYIVFGIINTFAVVTSARNQLQDTRQKDRKPPCRERGCITLSIFLGEIGWRIRRDSGPPPLNYQTEPNNALTEFKQWIAVEYSLSKTRACCALKEAFGVGEAFSSSSFLSLQLDTIRYYKNHISNLEYF